MCEEYEPFHDRTKQPVVGGQSSSSFVSSVIKTEVPLDCDDPAETNCKAIITRQLEQILYGRRISEYC